MKTITISDKLYNEILLVASLPQENHPEGSEEFEKGYDVGMEYGMIFVAKKVAKEFSPESLSISDISQRIFGEI